MKKFLEDEQTKMILATFYLTLMGFILIPAGAMISMYILDVAKVPYSLTGIYVAVGLVCAGWSIMIVESILTYRRLRFRVGE